MHGLHEKIGCRCGCCVPEVLGKETTNSSNPVWDLTEYQGDSIAPPGSQWRLRETGAGLQYGSGTVDGNGRLTGLQSEFRTSYNYDGFMRLEIGCVQENGTVKWPEEK